MMKPTIHHGNCVEVMRGMPAESAHAIVCDPPYGLEFMGKEWDRFGVGKQPQIGKPDGSKFRQNMGTPSFTDNGNPTCRNCGGDKYRNGPRKCSCSSPNFGNPQAESMRGFQRWCEEWATEALRVLKPGGHLLAFGGTRTWHRLAVAVEDAGFEMRDSIAWLYGQGFPKSLDVGKAIDKAAGAVRPVVGSKLGQPGYSLTNGNGDHRTYGRGLGNTGSGEAECSVTAPATDAAREWQGWGTALKPAHEPIVVARKPLVGTVAANVLEHGTGALNIDACRIAGGERPLIQNSGGKNAAPAGGFAGKSGSVSLGTTSAGRWPPNVALDESQAAALDEQSGVRKSGAWDGQRNGTKFDDLYGEFAGTRETPREASQGSASRFFYCAKAPTNERPRVNGIAHSTVKPLTLMRWLVRLVTPPDGTVLDPFAGSGTTIEAAILEGFDVIGIEREADYLPLIQARIDRATQDDDEPEQGALEFPA